MNTCVVKDCRNNGTSADSKVTFHLFPSNSVIYNEWVSAVRKSRGGAWRPTATSAVCSQHFYDYDMYVNRHGIRCVLSSGYPKKNLKIESKINNDAVATSPQPANAAGQSVSRSEDGVIDLSPEEADEPPKVTDYAPPKPLCISHAERTALQETWTMEQLGAFSKEYLKYPVLHTSSYEGYVFRRYQQTALDELAKSVGETNDMLFQARCLAFRHKFSELVHSLVSDNIEEGIDPARCLRNTPRGIAALAARLGLLRDALQQQFRSVNKTRSKMRWVGVAMCTMMYKAAHKYCKNQRDAKAQEVPIKSLKESLAAILPSNSLKVVTSCVMVNLWTRVCYVVKQKVCAWSEGGDRARRLVRRERLPRRLAAAHWRLADLLLAHTDNSFRLLAMYSVEAVRALTVLVMLVRCGSPLRLAADARARRRRWAVVQRAYTRTDRIATVLLLRYRFAQLCALAATHAPREPHGPHEPQRHRPPHPLLQVIINDGFVCEENKYWWNMESELHDDTEEDPECLVLEVKEAQELYDKFKEDFNIIEKCKNITALKKFIVKNLLKDSCDATAQAVASNLSRYTNGHKAQSGFNSNTGLNMDVEKDEDVDLDCIESKVNNNNNEDSGVIYIDEDSNVEMDHKQTTSDSVLKTYRCEKSKTLKEELAARRKDSRQSSIDERRFSSKRFDESSDDTSTVNSSSESDGEPLINIQAELRSRPELKGLSQRFLKNPTNQCLLSICKPAVVRLQRFDALVGRVVKKVELPDIDEVRRINRTLLTAEVAPITSRKPTCEEPLQWPCGRGLASELKQLHTSVRKLVPTHGDALDVLVNAMTVDYVDSKKDEEHGEEAERKRAKLKTFFRCPGSKIKTYESKFKNNKLQESELTVTEKLQCNNTKVNVVTVDYIDCTNDEQIKHKEAPKRKRVENTSKIKTYEAKFKNKNMPQSELTITEKVKSYNTKTVQAPIKPVLSLTVNETPRVLNLRNKLLDSLNDGFNKVDSTMTCDNSPDIITSEKQAVIVPNVSNVAVAPERQATSLQNTAMSADDSTDLDDLLSCTIIRKPVDDRSVETDEQTQPYLVSQGEKLIVDSEVTPLITNVCSLATDGAGISNVRQSIDNTASAIDGARDNKEGSGTTIPAVLNAVPSAGNPHLILNSNSDGSFEVQMGGNLFKVVGIWSAPDTITKATPRPTPRRAPKNNSKAHKSRQSKSKQNSQESTILAGVLARSTDACVSLTPLLVRPHPPPHATPPPPPPPLVLLSPPTVTLPEEELTKSVMKMNFVEPKILEPRPANMKNVSIANPRNIVYHSCPVRWVNPDIPPIPSLLFPYSFTTLEVYGESGKCRSYSIIRLDSTKPLFTIAEEYLIVTEKFLPCTKPTYWTLDVRNKKLIIPNEEDPNIFTDVCDLKRPDDVKDSTECMIVPETTVPEMIVPDFVCKDTVELGNGDTVTERTDATNDVKVKIEEQTSIVIENVCGSYVEDENKLNGVGDKDEKSIEVIDPAIASKPKLKVKSFADYDKVEGNRDTTDIKPEVLEKFGRHFRKLTDSPLRYAVVFTVVSSTKELDQLFRERARLHLLPYLSGRLFPLDTSEIFIPMLPKIESPGLAREPNIASPPVLPQLPKLTLMPNMTQPNLPQPPNSNLISNMTQPILPQPSNLTPIPNTELPNLTKAPNCTFTPQAIQTSSSNKIPVAPSPMVSQNLLFSQPTAPVQLPFDQKTALLVRHHDSRLLQDLAFKLQNFNKSKMKPDANQIYVFAPLDHMMAPP